MLHDRAERVGLHMGPVGAALRDGDEIAAEEHSFDAFNGEKGAGQRRGDCLLARPEFIGLVAGDGLAGQKFQRRRIGRRFRLDKHPHLHRRRVQGPGRCLFRTFAVDLPVSRAQTGSMPPLSRRRAGFRQH